MEFLYVLEGVTFRYRRAVRPTVEDVHLVIPPGRLTAIIGPNGAGKSTLLKLLGRRLEASEGTVFYRQQPVQTYPDREWAQAVAWLPQSPSIAFPIRVEDLVRLGRWPRRRTWFDRPRDAEVVARVLDVLGIGHLRGRWFHELSGGEQQLVHLARALAQEPETLLLDEPLTFLDFRHTVQVLSKLRQLVDQGLHVVVILHDLNLVAHYADWVILLHGGRVMAMGPPDEVLQYRHLKAAYETEVYVDLNDLTGRLIILPMPADWRGSSS
jgi:iron complex transport system ATP-binding protein